VNSNFEQSYTLKHILGFFVSLSLLCSFAAFCRAAENLTLPRPVLLEAGSPNRITQGLYYQTAGKEDHKLPAPGTMIAYRGKEAINLGFSKQDYWFYFQLTQKSQEAQWILEFPYPFHDMLDVWVIAPGRDTLQYRLSDREEFYKREIAHRNFLIPLKLSANNTTEVYCRLQCEGEASSFPVSVMSQRVFQQQNYRQQLALGLYYGILLFALLLSIFLVSKLRERAQYYYVFYLSGLALFQFSLDGYGFQYLWPFSPWLANHMIPVTGCLTLLFLTQFTRAFLHIKEHSPALSRTMQGASLLLALLFAFGLFENPFYYFSLLGSNLLALPVMILLLASAMRSLKNRIPSARYFSGAFVLLIMGSTLALLKNLGILPRVFITEYGIQIGSAVEIMMLSLGLAENLKSLKTENEMVQARLLQELQEKYHIQERAKSELEKKVEERTRELREKNIEIASKNKDITDSINYALRIQQATLPHDEELQELIPGSFVWYLPRDIVSGDFYWAGKRDGLIFIAVADCTGHGVPGSMMSMAANSFLSEIINVHGISSPTEILEILRKKIIGLLRQEKNQSRDGMDISLLVIDKEKRRLRFAGAFNPVYMLRKGNETPHEKAQQLRSTNDQTLWSLPANRFPVGMLSEQGHEAFTEIVLDLHPEDCFLMFTDGFADQFGGEKGKKLKSNAMQDIFFTTPYSELMKTFENTFNNWKGMHEQVDDVCILGFTIREI
jgi:serine phosphatase RsbU (regulator of sigma subunit)